MGDAPQDAHAEAEERALRAIDAHLWSGDEWEYVMVEPEDLGLPASTSAYEIEYWSYGSGLEETGRELGSDGQMVIECNFSVQLGVVATMARVDVVDSWDVIAERTDEADARMRLDMKGTVGVRMESDADDPDDLGGLEYISVSRADGTKGHPLAAGGEVLAECGPEGGRVIPLFPAAGILTDGD